MKCFSSFRSLLIPFGVILAGLALAVPVARGGDAANPGVFPVDSKPYGLTYGEWSARHWQWVFSLPIDGHPLFDTADCSEGQSGPVWFLGGTFALIEPEPGVIVGEKTRDCTIPAGKALFFPILDVECATLEGNGETEEELRECAEFFADFTVPESLSCTINGKPVKNLVDFRVQSPAFTYGPLPDNNILQFFGLDAPEGSTSLSVSDGYFVMVKPLPVGTHTIHFTGMADFTDFGGFVFILDITYNVTVVPKP